LANFLTPLAAAILTAMVATHGAEAVAGFTIATRIEALCLLVVFALSSTLPMFIGQNIGAGKAERAHQALIGALKFSIAFQLLIWLLMLISSGRIGPLFSDNQRVIEIASIYLWVVPASYGAQAVAVLVMVTLNVLRRPKTSLLITASRLLIICLPLAFIGGQIGGTPGLFYGYAAGNIIAGLMAWRVIHYVWDRANQTEFYG
jgi:Na+-driven multidrug efflux pump